MTLVTNFISALDNYPIHLFYIATWKKIKIVIISLCSLNILELVLLPSAKLNYAL